MSYSVKSARAIGCLHDDQKTRFVVGTLSLRDYNQVHVLDYDPDKNSVQATVYGHKNEVWHIAPSPTNAALLATCYSDATGVRGSCCSTNLFPQLLNYCLDDMCGLAGRGRRASLWRFPASTVPRDGCAPLARSPAHGGY